MFYKIIQETPLPQEKVTTMLINFGDNQNGENIEEPMNQEGSVANIKAEDLPQPQTSQATPALEKIITGTNAKITAPKVEKSAKKSKNVNDKSIVEKPITTNDQN